MPPVRDFLTHPYETNAVDWVITNPPFRLAEEFVAARISGRAQRPLQSLRERFSSESVGRYEAIYTKNAADEIRPIR